jgi:hypothetical protein
MHGDIHNVDVNLTLIQSKSLFAILVVSYPNASGHAARTMSGL